MFSWTHGAIACSADPTIFATCLVPLTIVCIPTSGKEHFIIDTQYTSIILSNLELTARRHITLCKTTPDFKTKVPFWPGLAWPGQSGTFVFKSTGGFAQRDVSPCITSCLRLKDLHCEICNPPNTSLVMEVRRTIAHFHIPYCPYPSEHPCPGTRN